MPDSTHQHSLFYEGDDIVESIKTYLLSVSVAAMICALAGRFLGKNGASAVSKMVTGLFLILTVLHPLTGIGSTILDDISFEMEYEMTHAVQQGEEETTKALARIIKEKTATYILQKAQTLRAEITVEVEVTDDPVPIPKIIFIHGKIAPYAKQQLEAIMVQELGISKENQIWT